MAKRKPQRGVVPASSNAPAPDDWSLESDMLPAQPGSSENMDSSYAGIVIECEEEHYEFLAAKFDVWFDGREEVELISDGTSEKMGRSYFVMEWAYCQIDPLFLKILDNEEGVYDYMLYIRAEEF